MRSINLLRVAALSLALIGPALSVAHADSDGRDGPTARQLRQEATAAQTKETQPQSEMAQIKPGIMTDAGAGLGSMGSGGVYDQNDRYLDPRAGFPVPGTSSESYY